MSRIPYGVVIVLSWLMGPTIGKKFLLSLRKQLAQEVSVSGIKFHCENVLTYIRAQLTYIKEDDTVRWVDSMKAGSVVWDIGANIGAISLKAAQRGHRVIAFEPMPGNYYALVKSICSNPFGDNISAFCVAIYSETKVSHLNTILDDIGAAHNVFDSDINNFGKKFNSLHRISAISITADEAVDRYKVPSPNYIKLDVDGNELDVLRGAKNILASNNLQGLLVEITSSNKEQTEQIFALLRSYGFLPQYTSNEEEGNAIFVRFMS
jgi:FkbM family methyltransferase